VGKRKENLKKIKNNIMVKYGNIAKYLVGKCLLSLGAESSVFQVAIQKLKD
jgi:hypothetical protein